MNFNEEWIKDPTIFNVNRLEAHSDHHYYASLDEAYEKKSSFVYSLNGIWKFHYAKNLEERILSYEARDYNCKGWDNIQVPGHIQMQGYGQNMYVNIIYPWSGHEQVLPGEVPTEFNPVGSYVKYFKIPENMKGKPIYIVFHGVESGMALWLNGKFVGYSEDSFTPSRFDLTPYIIDGENKLCVDVFRFTSGSWLEDQDAFRFSGIFRDVELYTLPAIHIQDLFVHTALLNNKASVAVEVTTKANETGEMIVEVYDENEKAVYYDTYTTDSQTIHFDVEHPHLWSAEKPYLYTMIITIPDHEVVIQKIGLREFKMDQGIMKINGSRIVFNGVNRHEFSPRHGRALTKEEIYNDLVMAKQNNINAIRTSHYPNQTYFYELADELGFYVIDECNLETHGTWANHYDMDHIVPHNKEEWLDNVLDRAKSMVQRDKNHPSIIIWSCGNEAFGGKDIYEMSQYFRNTDPSRLVHYEGLFQDRSYNATSDMESQMYPSAKDCEKWLQENTDKPMMLCEYTHSMGNSNGAMHKYTDLTKKYERFQGGFIWDFADQAIYTKDANGNEHYNYGGDFLERPSDYDFCGDGIFFASREWSPKLQEVRYNYQSIDTVITPDTIEITNRYLFTNTNELNAIISLMEDGILVESFDLIVDCKPGQSVTIDNPFVIEESEHEYALEISFTTKEATECIEEGYEIAYEQYIYPVKKEITQVHAPVEIIEDFVNVGIKGENFHVIFNKGKGLVAYEYLGKQMLKEIPRPNFYRPSNQNDTGNGYGYRYGMWLSASEFQRCYLEKYEVKDNIVTLHYVHMIPAQIETKLYVTYVVEGNGKITVTMDYTPDPKQNEMSEFGMLFALPLEYDQVEFYGYGPDENYIDRNKGARLGIYEYNIYDNFTPYLMPQECGNRTNVRNFDIYSHTNIGFRFESPNMEFSALPYLPIEIENAKHDYELPQPYQSVIRVNAIQMGIAGDDTWGARTHDEYLLSKVEPFHFTFSFIGTIHD